MSEIEMGEIIAFQTVAARPRRVPAEGAPEGASILFFTGVRYERPGELFSCVDPREPDDSRAGNVARKRKRRA